MIDEEGFRQLQLINVKCDVLIDEEEYDKLFKIIVPEGSDLAEELEIALGSHLGNKTVSEQEIRKKCYAYLSEKSRPENRPRLSVENVDLTGDQFKLWLPLFFAKAVRAYLSKDGSDKAMICLDGVLMYLHHNLPAFQDSNDHQNALLQHLYFQELAACGKPGLESLGYALRAADTLEAINPPPRLYRLWSGLNQGIGYWHSGQRMKAALEFNGIIRDFDQAAAHVSDDDKKYWRALLYDQAVLFRAELQEDLQFSYHKMKTLKRLDPNAKKEKRLIKEALAFRDMRRLDEALKKIKELLRGSTGLVDSNTTLKAIFDRFDQWDLRDKKRGIWSETFGLLFDFYLTKFEDQTPEEADIKDDIKTFTSKCAEYANELMKSKPERTSYAQQMARYLQWLSEKHKNSPKDAFFKAQIDNLYSSFRKHIKSDDKEIQLKDFDRYEYDRYVGSMEKFYRNCNNIGRIWACSMESDEHDFLLEVTSFEKEKFYLYDFKELERGQRLQTLGKCSTLDCSTPSKCFHEADYGLFHGLLNCMGNDVKRNGKPSQPVEPFRERTVDEVKELKSRDYEAIMMRENAHFLKYLQFNSVHPIPKPGKCSYHFLGLQRWNSQTPTLTLSQGGGYFLYKQDSEGTVILGIAIDPGFDFVDNLFHMGFTLKDINFILLTHAHLDHIRDFEPIVTAMLDLRKREKREKVKGRIHAIMSLGVYRKLENVITNTTLREFLADTYIVDIEREIVDRDKSSISCPVRFRRTGKDAFVSIPDSDAEFHLEVVPTKAYHDDYSERSDSFGYIINVKDADCCFSFGYSGDTRWHEDIEPQYSTCDVVCIHLGALIESEDDKNEKNRFSYYHGQHCEELIKRKWHPYLFGLLRWLKAIKASKNKNRLILLSEFGEELKGGIRIDLVRRLNEMFSDKGPVCIPVDIGLNVVLSRTVCDANPYQVWCTGCESFVDAENIRYRHFGYGRGDEALFYFCDTCLKSKPPNILQDKMRLICESGIPLRKREANSDRKSSI